MTVDSPIFRMLREIRDADMTLIDRELLRPAFAAFDGGQVCAVPDYVEKRIQHWAGRVAPQKP